MLLETDFEKITIKALAERAGINRKITDKVQVHFDYLKDTDIYTKNILITYLNSNALAMYRKWVSDKKRIPKDQFIALAAQLISAGILSIPGYLMSDSGRIEPL